MTAPTNLACEYCGAPISPRAVRPMAYRLKYHPGCKREVDRLRHTSGTADRTVCCDQCGDVFHAKRRDAKYCSVRCRVAAHRTAPRAKT